MNNNLKNIVFAFAAFATIGSAFAQGPSPAPKPKLVRYHITLEKANVQGKAVEFRVVGKGGPLGIFCIMPNTRGEYVIETAFAETEAIAIKAKGFLSDAVALDNVAEGGIVTMCLMNGDINGDNKVDERDMRILQAAFGSESGDKNYNMHADLDMDGFIDIGDYAILSANWGKRGNVAI